MDLPIEVINAVKPTAEPTPTAKRKARAPYTKKLTKRILHAIGNGLRTSTSIANALNLPKEKIQSNLAHMKNRGHVYSSKQAGKLEHKYHLTTDKPVLGTTDLTKPKRKLKAVKRKSTYNKDGVNTSNSFNTPPTPKPEHNVPQLLQRLSSLELTLVEKEKEVWTLECEVFDKKAIIKYLEEKLFVLGVR